MAATLIAPAMSVGSSAGKLATTAFSSAPRRSIASTLSKVSARSSVTMIFVPLSRIWNSISSRL